MIQSGLKNMPENKDIDYIFIASAPTKTYVLDAIKKTNFPYPIYYEQQYFSFKTINKFVLLDDIYNTMLLDKNQNLILFGAFYDNDKAKKLYSKAIECGLWKKDSIFYFVSLYTDGTQIIFIEVYTINQNSMKNTYKNGDRVPILKIYTP